MEKALAIAISSDSFSLAIFERQNPIFLEVHSHQNVPKHSDAAAGHVHRCLEHFLPTAIVLHKTREESDVCTAVINALRIHNKPVFEIEESAVLASFGEPPLQDKDELRQLMRILFPQIPSNNLLLCCFDALALGLYFQTKQLLNVNALNE